MSGNIYLLCFSPRHSVSKVRELIKSRFNTVIMSMHVTGQRCSELNSCQRKCLSSKLANSTRYILDSTPCIRSLSEHLHSGRTCCFQNTRSPQNMYSSQPPPQEPQTSDTQVRNIIMDHLQRGSFYQTFRLFPCILLLKI